MITANTPTRKRTRRHGRKRERTLWEATLLAVVATFSVALLLAILLMLIPNTALHFLYDLYAGQVGISPQSPLYQEIMGSLQNEQNYFVAPLSFLFGGLVLGASAPRRLSRGKIILIGGVVALVVNLVLLGLLGAAFYHSILRYKAEFGKQVTAPALQLSEILRQTAAILAWSACSMVGAFFGTWKRRTIISSEAA